ARRIASNQQGLVLPLAALDTYLPESRNQFGIRSRPEFHPIDHRKRPHFPDASALRARRQEEGGGLLRTASNDPRKQRSVTLLRREAHRAGSWSCHSAMRGDAIH